MYPAKMWSPSSNVSDSCFTEYNSWNSRIRSKNMTAAIFTQGRLSSECNVPVIPVAGFEVARASAFIISPHQQYMKRRDDTSMHQTRMRPPPNLPTDLPTGSASCDFSFLSDRFI